MEPMILGEAGAKSCASGSCRGGRAVMMGLFVLMFAGLTAGGVACACHHASTCAPNSAAPVSSPASPSATSAPQK